MPRTRSSLKTIGLSAQRFGFGGEVTLTIDVSRLSNFVPGVLLFYSRVNIVRFLYSFLCVRNDRWGQNI